MEIPKNLKDEIWDYCRLNNISNIDEFTLKLIKQGFTMEKFGATPITKTTEKIIEKIVEVPVEKEIYITDDSNIKEITTLLSEANATIHKMANDHGIEANTLNRDLQDLRSELELVKKKLEVEKNKKNDLYGE